MLKTDSPSRTGTSLKLLRFASAVPVICLGLWAAISWYQSLASIVRFHEALPYEDYWAVVQHLSQYRAFDLRVLWKAHNEHRIIFPEIVFACDMLFAKGQRLLPFAASVLCYAGVFVTLSLIVSRDRGWAAPNRWAAIFLAATVMGWKGSAFVLAEPFLLQWPLTQLAVVLSLALLTAVPRRGNKLLAGSTAAAVVATYSSGNGMFLWPVLITAGLLLKLRRREMGVLTASGALAVGCYFIGYQSSSRLNLSNFFLHPRYSLEFLGAYMSMPFGGMKGPHFGAYLGLICIAVMLLLCITAVRKQIIGTAPAIVLFGYYAFTVLTAAATGAGRMDVTDIHYAGAESTRYLTLPLASWAVFVITCIWVSARLQWRVLGPWTLTALFAVLLLLGFPKLRWWLRSNQRPFIQSQFTSLAVQNGITDNNLLAMIFPDPWFVRSRLPELRSDRLSIFTDEKNDPAGKRLSSFGQVIGRTAEGRLTYVFPVENGLEVAGFLQPGTVRSKRILLANEKGMIVGFGRHLPAGFPSFIPAPSKSLQANWVGFANLKYPSSSVAAYVLTPKGILELGSTVQVPPARAVNPRTMGEPIAPITWRTEPVGPSDQIPLRLSNPPGPIYSTWKNGDAEQAIVESSVFKVPADHCLVLPVLTGPSTEPLSVVVLDGDTDQIAARVPMQNESANWEYWQMTMPAGVRSVRIRAQDRGSEFGQWLAIAEPRSCR